MSLLNTFWNFLTAPSFAALDIQEQKIARLTASISLVLFSLLTAGMYFSYQRDNDLQNAIFSFGITVVISLIAYAISRTSLYAVGGFLLVIGFYLNAITNIVVVGSDIRVTFLFYMPLGLVIGSALLSPWALFLALGISVAAIYSIAPLGTPLPENIGGVVGIDTAIGLLLILFINYRNSIERARLNEIEESHRVLDDLRLNLEKRVEERTHELNRRADQLESTSIIARRSAEIKELGPLLEEASNLIALRLGFYHVGIFLLDEGGTHAVLSAASSKGGKNMIARGHQLAVGRQGIVGAAAATKQSRMASDVGADATYFNNPELPDTHAEMALPLISQGKVIGVLDIQANEGRAFTQQDNSILQILADQLALSIENTRLITDSQATLKQLQELTGVRSTASWKRRTSQARGYRYTPLSTHQGTIANDQALATADDESAIQIPVTLRGLHIGSISMKRKGSAAIWTEKEKELIEEIGGQIGLALENARLFEETRSRAEKEQRVGEIAREFSRMTSMESLLESAVAQLGKTLNADEAAIEINLAES
jgi:GAF domain-containing protein